MRLVVRIAWADQWPLGSLSQQPSSRTLSGQFVNVLVLIRVSLRLSAGVSKHSYVQDQLMSSGSGSVSPLMSANVGLPRAAVRPLLMSRYLPAIAAFAGFSLTGLALYPVLARDLDGFDFTDPLDLVLPPEPVAVTKASAPFFEARVVPAKAIVEPESEVIPPPEPPKPVAPLVISTHSGEASWYGPGLYGNRTANGEVFRRGTMTAAHRTLPFGTRVRVTNLWNGRKAVVRINDRGPFAGDRVIDLAHGAASELGLTSSGIAQVRLEVLR